MSTIAVIDYGMGNLRSVYRALEHVTDKRILVTQDAAEIRAAERVVFPGQGAMGAAMHHINGLGLGAILAEVFEDRPFLGICLGLQVLMQHSEEDGGTDGYGLLPGTVKRFATPLIEPDNNERLKVPHMGWNQVQQQRSHPLWQGIADNSRFYFVHSYYVSTGRSEDAVGNTRYGVDFTAAAARDNVFAVQFHPEKSQHDGLQLLKNFVSWDGKS